MRSLFGSQVEPDILIQRTIRDSAQRALITDRLTRLLRRQHALSASQPDDFRIHTPEQLTQTLTNITAILTLAVGSIVAISLVVGGIGMMNMMLVSVTERTRDIGIGKAVGATRRHIWWQCLLEAVVLSLGGGLIGIALGYGLGTMVASLLPGFPAVQVPWWVVGSACGFAALVGIVFGMVPTAKAARLDPIVALRYA